MQGHRTRPVRNSKIAVAIVGLILAATLPARFGWAGTTASGVLGQTDFSHNTANSPNASSLNTSGDNISGVAVDRIGGFLYVADGQNNRVLGYSGISALTNGEGASLVIGQPDFETTTANSQPQGQKNLWFPSGVAVDSNENVYVADYDNQRILIFANPFATMASTGQMAGFSAFMVIGQGGDFSARSCNVGGSLPSNSTICDPNGIGVDSSNNLWVADGGNNRVIEFDDPVGTNNLSANLVLGQPDFVSNKSNQGSTVSAKTLSNPAGVAIDSHGNVYVTDFNNNRALEFNAPTTNDPGANLVWGQAGSLTTGNCNNGGISVTSVCEPIGVSLDISNNVYIADWANNRVLEFNETGSHPTNVSANAVLGQTSTTTNNCVNNTGLSAANMCEPSTTATDNTKHVYVVDEVNNRALVFNPTITTGKSASVVLGQTNFTHSAANNVKPGSLDNPFQVAIDPSSTPNHLYVADYQNSRVLGWLDADSFTNGQAADFVLGQPDFQSRNCNQGTSLSATTLCNPVGVAVDSSGNLYVTDFSNNRALEYTAPITSCTSFPCTYTKAAHKIFGQTNFTTGTCNAGGVSTLSLCQPQELAVDAFNNLYIADGGNNRVLEYNTPLTATSVSGSGNSVADLVFGQGGSFLTNSCNNGGVSATSLCDSYGVALDPSTNAVYIADYNNSRILEYNETTSATKAPSNVTANIVFGHSGSFTATGCSTGPNGMCNPYGVWVDTSGNLYATDDAYNRALEFFTPVASSNTTADVVWGQGGSFFSTSSNLGGIKPSAQTLFNPVGIAIDATGNLLVGDFSNNRVLEFEPTTAAREESVELAKTSSSAGSLKVGPGNLSFPTTAVGHRSAQQTVRITNIGSVPVTIGQIVISDDFVKSDGCGGALPTGVSCELRVAFRPITGGSRGGKLVISDDAWNSPQVVSLTGTASGAN